MGYESGKLTGTLVNATTSKFKKRVAWNVFFSVFLLIVLLFFGWIYSHLIFDGFFTLESKQEYVKYEGGDIYTNEGKLKLNGADAGTELALFLKCAEPGDMLELTISKTSGFVKEIKADNAVLYEEKAVLWEGFWVISPVALLCIGTLILAIIGVNIKNPKGFWKKFPYER